MLDLRHSINTIIEGDDPWRPIEIYAVAETLRNNFPEKSLDDLVKEVCEVAIRTRNRSVLWNRDL